MKTNVDNPTIRRKALLAVQRHPVDWHPRTPSPSHAYAVPNLAKLVQDMAPDALKALEATSADLRAKQKAVKAERAQIQRLLAAATGTEG